MLKGNLIFGQSGGPTSVINSSAAGIILEAREHSDMITKIYGAHYGIVGILEEDFFDLTAEDKVEIKLLRQTPSSFLGSCRYKLTDPEVDDSDYARILEVFRKYDIRYFLYNGGNDSMDTCFKIGRYLKEHDYECRVIGVPKTIDNDLAITDHCPGYGSAARYVATTIMELYQDATVYNSGQITIVEVMGRNAGWLTAASALALEKGAGPDLIYLPERVFEPERVIEDTARIYSRQNKVIICVSEGVRTADGKYLTEMAGQVQTDAFGHKQMGGTAEVLSRLINEKLPTKIRAIEFSLMQRSAAHLASRRDVDDSFTAGAEAVLAALRGETEVMIGFKRPEKGLYRTDLVSIPLKEVANTEKKVPLEMISKDGNGIESSFLDYARPLIYGRPDLVLEDSLPRFAKLKLVRAGKRA